jgi:hypothetical protein
MIARGASQRIRLRLILRNIKSQPSNADVTALSLLKLKHGSSQKKEQMRGFCGNLRSLDIGHSFAFSSVMFEQYMTLPISKLSQRWLLSRHRQQTIEVHITFPLFHCPS